MGIFDKFKQKRESVTNDSRKLALWLGDNDDICVNGYTSLDKNPEIMTACRRIAELIGSMTIHLMANSDKGDVRVINELSRAIDIAPISTMTRSHWMEAIVMNLLLYGEGKKEAWNSFIQNTIRPICVNIAQELTRKLIISPKMYLKFNVRSLMDWDIQQLYQVYGGLTDRGIVTGNETRDILGMSPMDGLDELKVLENYVPLDMIGLQNKLTPIKGDKDE